MRNVSKKFIFKVLLSLALLVMIPTAVILNTSPVTMIIIIFLISIVAGYIGKDYIIFPFIYIPPVSALIYILFHKHWGIILAVPVLLGVIGYIYFGSYIGAWIKSKTT